MSIFSRANTVLRNRIHPTTPLIEVGISKEALLHNLNAYREQYPGIQLAPVLKSNAYGHDLGLVARVLDKEEIAFFMVDSLYEARRLREAGVRSRVVMMGYSRPKDIIENRLPNVDFAITDLSQLRQVAESAMRPLRIHLKLDTGLHRQGITPEFLSQAIAIIQHHPRLKLVGICSHLADADIEDSFHAKVQIRRWKEMSQILFREFPSIAYRHLSATKGIRFAHEADTNVARIGIGLYGFDTAPAHDTSLMPALEMRSLIGELRTIEVGESVGYNATYTATRETRVATIPCGYYEGVDRRLSNRGMILVRGVACPIIGRVSMNMTTIDVTDVPDSSIGDVVTIISRDLAAPNSIPGIARAIGDSNYRESEYVVLVHIPQHLRRVLE